MQNKTKYNLNEATYFKAIDWNLLEENIDKLTWDKLVSQFWVDTRIPVSNDLDDWRLFTDVEKKLIGQVFASLTMLDTLQSEQGTHVLAKDVRTQHEGAVLNNIAFMESIHAKSYSTIFSTLNTKAEIEELFQWANNNRYVQEKARMINEVYKHGTALQKKVASVFLESFLFYSGFFAPLYYSGRNKLMNVGEIISLIIRDESVHGTYIGAKFKLAFAELDEQDQEDLMDWSYEFLAELYNIEQKYTKLVYDEIGLSEKVLTYVQYNGNKALQNLGFDPLFNVNVEDVDPVILNGISTTSKVNDFFSSVGNSYLIGDVEAMDNDDYVKYLKK